MYRLFSPTRVLRPYVECYWTLQVSQSQPQEIAERVFVDGRADMIFNFGYPYQRRTPGPAGGSESITQSNLDALRDQPVLIAQEGEIYLVGVRFKPGGLSKFIPVPLNELRNQVIDLAAIFGPAVLELEKRLYDYMARPAVQITILERYLLSRFSPSLSREFALHVGRRISESAGRISIAGLSREFGYSARHLDRLYQPVYGMSPKFHARVSRFQAALRLLLTYPKLELSDIAAACGYYDQPHFYREFNEFAGQSPNEYRAQTASRLQISPPPNLKDYTSSMA